MSWRDKPWVTMAEAGEILSFSRQRIERLIRGGKLRARKEGRQVLILTASMLEYIEGLSAPGEVAAEPPSPAAEKALRRAMAGRS